MHLCVTFGEPSPRALLAKLSVTELAAWRKYAENFGLPSELTLQASRAMSTWYSTTNKRKRWTDYLYFAKPTPPGQLSDLKSRLKAQGRQIMNALKGKRK